MRILKFQTLFALITPVVAFASHAQQCENARYPVICIDDQLWELSRLTTECESRVQAAVTQYEKAPLYSAWRKAYSDRMLVNETSDCWIELNIEGVDGASYLFKVTADHEVIDQRAFSYWLPHIRPYPTGPVYLDDWEHHDQ